MNFNIYNVDFNKLIRYFLPRDWLEITHISFLASLITPVETLRKDFLTFRNQINYRLSHNSQVVYLQKVLNDQYDSELRRIYINNGVFIGPLYAYKESDNRPFFLGTQIIYKETELVGGDADFIVIFPKELRPANAITIQGYLSDIKATVNEYKLASKTFSIQFKDE